MRYLLLILPALSLSNGLASPILNGGFESPTLTATQNLAGPFTLPGWTGQGPSQGGNAGLVLGPDNGLAPAEGTQHLNLNGGNPSDHGYLEQTIATTPGAAYDLTFALGRAGGGQLLSLSVSLWPKDPEPVEGLDQTYLPPPTTGYTYHTHAFTAIDSLTTLRFTDTSGPNSISDLYLDAISVTQRPSATAAAVPDTTGGESLLIVAIMLMALRHHRR